MKNTINRGANKNLALAWLSFLFLLATATLFVLSSFDILPFISPELKPLTRFILIALMIVLVLTTLWRCLAWKKTSNQVRFNYATFSLVKNIRSERVFLNYVDKKQKRNKGRNDVVIAFGINRFKKTVFTRYGYEKGAELLEIIYSSLNPMQKQFPHSTYGYDYNENFLVFLEKVELDDIKNYVEKLTNEINERLLKEKNEVKFIGDFGASFNHDENGDLINAPSMLQRALIAADHGRSETDLGGLTVYDVNMFERNKRNVQLGIEIERGLDLNQFTLHYQPKFDLKLGRFAGSEALVRWQHPELGLLSPASFILFAEQSDLIVKLDQYVLEKVCMQLDAWRGQGLRLLPVSINISKRTLFTGNVVNHLINITNKYNINPMLLEIEIVESPSLQDILLLLSIVKKFKSLKIKIAIDDFGTGYSSLSYIKKIPFDVIKIDKAFLDDVDVDQKSRLVIKNIIDLAHILDAYVVIEGVQDEKQVRMLESMNADAIQGFYFSRPLPPDKFQEFLEDNLFEFQAKKTRGKKK